MAIHTCKDCVAPKRYPGCHGSCTDYLTAKAEHDRLKAIYDRERAISSGILGNRVDNVYKALKDRRNKRL